MPTNENTAATPKLSKSLANIRLTDQTLPSAPPAGAGTEWHLIGSSVAPLFRSFYGATFASTTSVAIMATTTASDYCNYNDYKTAIKLINEPSLTMQCNS